MKKQESQETTAEFEPASRSDSNPVAGGRLQARGTDSLEELKQRLLQEIAGAGMGSANLTCLRRAAEEAASLAWTTSFPLLVLPELFFEKAAEARVRSQRQREIWQRSMGLTGQ